MEQLQQQWKHLYSQHLPALAKARDASQKHWPVHLDHCFARIILDNAVGVDKPWTAVLSSPAIRHMSRAQITEAISMGEAIATGKADIDALNQRSLELRGKAGPTKKRKVDAETEASSPKKVKRSESGTVISSYFLPSPHSPEQHNKPSDLDMTTQLKRIADSDITPFRKQTLSLLCQIPRGRYSTYQAMSDFITQTSHKTCARAVGSAMRSNPFAPLVPCHRILATGGSLGGFGGHWGEEGKFASEKHRLLQEEGVRFDSKGKVKGPVFRDFQSLSD